MTCSFFGACALCFIPTKFLPSFLPLSSLCTSSPPPPPPQTVQQRGAAVIKARKLSSAMSAAKAICDHMKDIWFGTREVRPP